MSRLQAAVVALLALIIAPGYSFYFDVTPKIVVLLAGTGAVLLWMAFSGIPVSLPDRSRKVLTAFSVLLLLNAASLAVSTALSAQPAFSLFGTNWRRSGSVIQLAVCLFSWSIAVGCAGRPERVRTLLRGVTGAGAATALYGIGQYLGADPFLPAASYHVGEGIWTIVRPPGTLGYASYFATWLLFVVFLSLHLRTMETSTAWRRVAETASLLAGCAMVMTGTRAALLGLAAGGVVWIAVGRIQVTRRTLALAGAAILAGAIFYYAPPGQQLRSRARWFAEDARGGARLDLWRDSVHMASHRLAAGYGPEVFTAEFPQYESATLAQSFPDFAHESPHNMFLDTLVAQGVPGLLVLAALCGLGFAAALRWKLPALAGALAAGVVSQQFTSFTVPTALLLFVTLGLVVAVKTPAVTLRRSRSWAAGATVVAAGLLYCAARLAAADSALASAKDGLDRGDVSYAAAQFQQYERLHLPGGTGDLWYARAALALASESPNPQTRAAALREASTAAVSATQTAEDPFNAWYNLAVFCGSREDGPCVERSLRAAIRAYPNWFKPHWTLAQVLQVQGRMEEARREAALAAALDGGKHPEVARTLDEMRAELNTVQPRLAQK
ncbi:MAG: O-antigen ligase family protein [Acidobacteriia bacterium]|nr:O-antigen ligase family protein [Terriglobia bacterium]